MAVLNVDISEINKLHARNEAVSGQIYFSESKYYRGTDKGRLEDVTDTYLLSIGTTANAAGVASNEDTAENHEQRILALESDTEENRTTLATKADKCYAIAMSIIL